MTDAIRHQEILDKDVEKWTKADLKFMVDYYRDLREKFQLSEATKKSAKAKGEPISLPDALKATF